jgi:hypothetical protein
VESEDLDAKAFWSIGLWSFGIARRDLQSGSKAPGVHHADGALAELPRSQGSAIPIRNLLLNLEHTTRIRAKTRVPGGFDILRMIKPGAAKK